MGVFHPRPAVLAMLALTSASAVVAALPSWSDIFSSLQPYEDEAEEDVLDFAEDEARQFITINTNNNNFNTTLNLTGHILLGLGIASSLLLWMYLNAFGDDSYGYGHEDGYDRKKIPNTVVLNRTINLTGIALLSLGISAALSLFMLLNGANQLGITGTGKRSFSHEAVAQERSLSETELMIPTIVARMEERFRERGLSEAACWPVATCEASRPDVNFNKESLGEAVRQLARTIVAEQMEVGPPPKSPALLDPRTRLHGQAARLGTDGKDCKRLMEKCKHSYQEIQDILKKQLR